MHYLCLSGLKGRGAASKISSAHGHGTGTGPAAIAGLVQMNAKPATTDFKDYHCLVTTWRQTCVPRRMRSKKTACAVFSGGFLSRVLKTTMRPRIGL